MTHIAVTGATGNLGRATLQSLLDSNVSPATVVPIARDLSKTSDLSGRGFSPRQADYTDLASLEAAFRGTEKLLFISTSAVGEERMVHHRNVVTAAKRAGVGHIIYTSVVKPAATANFSATPGHFHTEELIRETGIPYTFFRNNLYLELVPMLFGSAVQTGTLTHIGGNGRVGFVARQDIAEALAVVLTSGKHENRAYPISVKGRAYSLPEIATALGQAAGKPVVYQDLSVNEFRKMLESFGLPAPLVDFSVGLGEAIRAGEFEESSPQLETLLGRAPLTLQQFLATARP